MNWTLFISIFIGTIISRLICDYLFNDDKEEKKQDERSDE